MWDEPTLEQWWDRKFMEACEELEQISTVKAEREKEELDAYLKDKS